MAHTVRITPQAEKFLHRLRELETRRRLVAAIAALATTPRPPGCRKLEGEPELWRIRTGDYRIVYRIDDGALGILVVTIGHRREIYR